MHYAGRRCRKKTGWAARSCGASRRGTTETEASALTTHGVLETTLAGVEREAETALKAAGMATTQLRKARAAAKTGQLRDLRKAVDAA